MPEEKEHCVGLAEFLVINSLEQIEVLLKFAY